MAWSNPGLFWHGVFKKEEFGFGRITDSPREAVELIVRRMPVELRKILKPQPLHKASRGEAQ